VDRDELLAELQGIFRRRPVLVLGCGASAAMGASLGVQFPGMGELADHLRGRVPELVGGKPGPLEQWGRCAALLDAVGLEQALTDQPVRDRGLLRAIVDATAELVGTADRVVRETVLSGGGTGLALARALGFLLDSVDAVNPVVHVVTPNYDHVVEYACFAARALCLTSFRGSVVGSFEPDPNKQGNLQAVAVSRGRGRSRREPRPLRHVALWKPHGSLSWFEADGTTVELGERPSGAERVMVTPGVGKYETCMTQPALVYHREKAGEALRRASAVVFCGYGFNDRHLETALLPRLRQGLPGAVLSRELTSAARRMVADHPRLLALEAEAPGATLCHCPGGPLRVDGDLWDLDHFLREVIGR